MSNLVLDPANSELRKRLSQEWLMLLQNTRPDPGEALMNYVQQTEAAISTQAPNMEIYTQAMKKLIQAESAMMEQLNQKRRQAITQQSQTMQLTPQQVQQLQAQAIAKIKGPAIGQQDVQFRHTILQMLQQMQAAQAATSVVGAQVGMGMAQPMQAQMQPQHMQAHPQMQGMGGHPVAGGAGNPAAAMEHMRSTLGVPGPDHLPTSPSPGTPAVIVASPVTPQSQQAGQQSQGTLGHTEEHEQMVQRDREQAEEIRKACQSYLPNLRETIANMERQHTDKANTTLNQLRKMLIILEAPTLPTTFEHKNPGNAAKTMTNIRKFLANRVAPLTPRSPGSTYSPGFTPKPPASPYVQKHVVDFERAVRELTDREDDFGQVFQGAFMYIDDWVAGQGSSGGLDMPYPWTLDEIPSLGMWEEEEDEEGTEADMSETLRRELCSLGRPYVLVHDKERSVAGQYTVLLASIEPGPSTPCLPPLHITVPTSYPTTPPTWSLDPGYGCMGFGCEVRDHFNAKAKALSGLVTVTMLVELLDTCIQAMVCKAL